MKVLGINGSARVNGNTAIMMERVFSKLRGKGIECEMIQLAGETIHGCNSCDQCMKNLDERCCIDDDIVNDLIQKMKSADGLILGSPVYFSNITPEMKALIDRTGRVLRANDHMMKRKVGASIVAVRRAGALPAFNDMNYFFFVEQMIVPGSSYWNLCMGKDIGDVLEDEEGMRTMDDLAENFAWVLEKIKQ